MLRPPPPMLTGRAAGPVDPVAAGDWLIREPGSHDIDFLIPGLVGTNAVLDARCGTPKRLIVATPMPRHYQSSAGRLAGGELSGGAETVPPARDQNSKVEKR